MDKTIDFNIVADLYDSYVSTELDIPFFIKETEDINGDILELMCGTGRISIPLIQKGIRLTCIDKSEKMLDVFRKKINNNNIDIIQADALDFSLNKKFQLIFIPFHSFSELLTYDDQLLAMHNIYAHLEDGGTFLCTLQNPKVRLANTDGQLRVLGKFAYNDDLNIIISYYNTYDPGSKIVSGMQFYEIYDNNNVLKEKRFLEINFRPPELTEFRQMADKCGFNLEKIYGDYSYSDFDIDSSPFMICFLRK